MFIPPVFISSDETGEGSPEALRRIPEVPNRYPHDRPSAGRPNPRLFPIRDDIHGFGRREMEGAWSCLSSRSQDQNFTFTQPFQEKCISEVVRTGTRIIFQPE